MCHQPPTELSIWFSRNTLVCSWNCFWIISTFLVIWKHIWLNSIVFRQMSKIRYELKLQLGENMFMVFLVSYLATLCLRKGIYSILKKLQPLSTCRNQKPPKTFKFSMAWFNFIIVSFGTLLSSWPWLWNCYKNLNFF